MPDLPARAPCSIAPPSRLPRTAAISLALHALVLTAIFLWRSAPLVPDFQPAEPTIAMVFETAPDVAPIAPPAAPQVNLYSPDDAPEPTPPPLQQADAFPTPLPPLRPKAHSHHPQKSANPFANVQSYGLESPAASATPGASSTASADWFAEVHDWGQRRIYAPREATEKEQEGVSAVELTIARDGTVRKVRLVQSSGFRLLDMASLAIYRDHKVPAFPYEMPGDQVVFIMNMSYTIIHN